MINKQKEKVQEEAYQAWKANEKMGLCELSTGTGKTFVFFRACLSMPKGSNILFLAETTVREKTILDDALKFKEFYGINPLEGYKFKFACYQAAYKYSIWDYFPNATIDNTLIGLDEIHDCISSEYFKFVQNSDLQNNTIPRIGLSATVDRRTIYEIQGVDTTKFDILKTFCPVVYTYTLQESIDSKSIRETRFFVLKHNLDQVTKNIEAGLKDAKFLTTEHLNYAYLEKSVKMAMFAKYNSEADKKFRIIQTATRRARFLYSLPSKIKACKQLIFKLPGRTLIFGQDSKSLLELCPTAIVSENKNYIKDLANFKSGKTDIGASNKILKQGENIPDLDNIILVAYYSKVKDFVQMIGRGLRENKKVANIIIFLTIGSQEEKWFDSMTAELNQPFIYCKSVDELLKQI